MIHSYLYLSIILFCLGIVGVISRRNVFTVFMSIELMLNAANLAFVAFSRVHESMDGQVVITSYSIHYTKLYDRLRLSLSCCSLP